MSDTHWDNLASQFEQTSKQFQQIADDDWENPDELESAAAAIAQRVENIYFQTEETKRLEENRRMAEEEDRIYRQTMPPVKSRPSTLYSSMYATDTDDIPLPPPKTAEEREWLRKHRIWKKREKERQKRLAEIEWLSQRHIKNQSLLGEAYSQQYLEMIGDTKYPTTSKKQTPRYQTIYKK